METANDLKRDDDFMHLRHSLEDLSEQLSRDKISIDNVVETLECLTTYYRENGYGN